MTGHAEKAKQLFFAGYNCAQAVFCAFAEELGLDEKTARALSSSFGGGMGRMRLVCGTQSGAYMVLGLYYGDYDPKNNEEKATHYARIREIADSFQKVNGSLLCNEILASAGQKAEVGGQPEERTEGYYTHRKACYDSVYLSAQLVEDYINDHPKNS